MGDERLFLCSCNVFQTHEPRRGLAERSEAVGLMLSDVENLTRCR
jgi:hypothetical protein